MVKIGSEIHGYLNTSEKLFCRCKAEHGMKFSKPNTNICPVCTGMPGAKPMLPNKMAINQVVQISLILGCKINSISGGRLSRVILQDKIANSQRARLRVKGNRAGVLAWQRKHYDWPDLPRGFQSTISGTYATPISEKGKFLGIRIRETHLEEDPAAWNPTTGEVDYNRSGSPLIEIVTEPDFRNSDDVVSWLSQLITTLDYVKAIDKNSGIKIDVNVSLPEFKTERTEIKNINSLSSVKAAIEYETQRQKKEKPIRKETRTFDDSKGITIKMREKEQAEDYRFISEPDLPVVKINKSLIAQIKSTLPETPNEKLQNLVKKHKIEKKYAEILTKKLEVVEFFEKIVEKVTPSLAIHWVTGELLRVLNYAKKELDEVDIKAEHFIELLGMIEKNMITALKGKEILNRFIPKSFSPKKEISEHSVIGSEKEIEKIIEKIVRENSHAVGDYKSGKLESLNYLLGQIMKHSNKRIDSNVAKKILIKELEK